MKKIFKSPFNYKISFIVKKTKHIIDTYDVSYRNAKHVKSCKMFIKHP